MANQTKAHIKLDGTNVEFPNKIILGANPSWGKRLIIGGDANSSTANDGSIGVTNGNLHIDAASGNATYLNFYDGTSGVAFGSGAGAAVAWMGPDGDLWKGSADNTGYRYWHAANDGAGSTLDADLLDGQHGSYYLDTSGTGQTKSGDLTADQFISTNNGSGTNYRVGDDAWIGDINVANTLRISGVQNSNNGYITFGNSSNDALGRAGTGALTWAGNTIWHAGNDGSGTGLDADLLDGVQGNQYLRSTSNPSTAGSNANTTISIGDSGTSYAYVQSHGSKPLNFNPAGNAVQINGNRILTVADEGSGNGLDADTVDNIQASSFLRSDAADSYSSTITATGDSWYLWGLGARGASAGQYGIGNRASDSYRQLTFHVPNQAAYSSTGTIPSFGWYSNDATELMKLESASGNLWMKGNATVEGNLTIGKTGTTPLLDMMFVDHASGAGWDTRIQIGKSDDFAAGTGVFPTYLPAGAYGTQIQANSDGVFFGMEEYTTGHYRPVIQWGDDDSDTPFRIKHENGSELEVSYNGNVTTTGDLTVGGGDIVLNGVGRIQGVDTVSSGTDAANKTYVDNAISSLSLSNLTVDSKKLIDMPSNSTERGPWNPIVSAVRGSGRRIYPDEEFRDGTNGVSVYNNAGGDGVTITREADSTTLGQSAPNSTGMVLKIVHNGNSTSPGHGGFIHTISSQDNHTFVQIFQAKLESGRNLNIAENAQGSNNTSYWLTNNSGTGKWEWYARVSHCGDSGTFSSGGHVYVSGGGSTFTWYIASSTVIDVTEAVQGELSVFGDIILEGDPTSANQTRSIKFTGFDKEGTTDFSDNASIYHTTNVGGLAGSVLVFESQNDSNDGIAFITNASSNLRHNSNTILTSGNYSSTLDGRYIPKGGSWYGDSMPGSRYNGFSVNGGEIVLARDNPNNAQMSILLDGNYYAGENNGFWSLYSNNSYNSKVGFYSNSSGHLLLSTNATYAGGKQVWTDYPAVTNANDYNSSSGTWNTGTNASWGNYKIGDAYAYNDAGNGNYVQYNVPSGMKTAYIGQLRWSSGGYFDVHAVESDGDLVFRGRFTSYQNIENNDHGGGHDGQEVIKVSGLDGLSAIRITNRTGRIHLQGVGWTKETDVNTTGQWGPHWDTVLAKPSTFSPSSHNHAASEITSGTLDAARLPSSVFLDRGSISITTGDPFDDSHTQTQIAENGMRTISYTGASAFMYTWNNGGSASVVQLGAHYNGTDFYMRTRTDSSTWRSWRKLWHDGNFTPASYLRSDAADTASAKITFTANESIGLKGARGGFSNEYIHLYNKVGIGHPSGWGQGEGDTPDKGLSTYGAINVGYGVANTSTFHGAVIMKGQATMESSRSSYWNYNDKVALQLMPAANDGAVAILFPSIGNATSDFAYIAYDEDYGEAGVTAGENGALILGCENDGGGSSDHVRVKGRLVVEADMSSSDPTKAFQVKSSNTTSDLFHVNRAGGGYLSGTLNVTGDVVAYYSDMRLKTKLEDLTGAVNKINLLNGFYYEPNEKALELGYKKEKRVGLSAQEVQEVLPEAVTKAPISNDPEVKEEYLSVDYAKLVPLLVEGIKELKAEIEELKKQIK